MEEIQVTENKRNSIKEEERGASMLEYALLAALIAVVAIAAVTFLGEQVCRTFSGVASTMEDSNDAGLGTN